MTKRLKSVDIFKGIAIILMIQVHLYKFWTKRNYGLIGDVFLYLGDFAGPLFLIASGIGFYILLNNKIEKNITSIKIFKEVLIRAIILFSITILALIVFGNLLGIIFSTIIYWSVFQVIAFSMILFFTIPFLKRNVRFTLYFCSMFTIFLLFFIIPTYEIEFLYILTNRGIFDFIPYANFFVFGMLVSDLLKNADSDEEPKILLVFSILGIICLSLWIFWLYSITIFYISLFVSIYGFFFITFSLLFYYSDMKKFKILLQDTLSHWGKFSFSIYYIHYVILGIALYVFPLIFADFNSIGLLFYQYIIFFVLTFVSIDIFLRIWKKFDYIFGVEWFINLFIKKSLFSELQNQNEDSKEKSNLY